MPRLDELLEELAREIHGVKLRRRRTALNEYLDAIFLAAVAINLDGVDAPSQEQVRRILSLTVDIDNEAHRAFVERWKKKWKKARGGGDAEVTPMRRFRLLGKDTGK